MLQNSKRENLKCNCVPICTLALEVWVGSVDTEVHRSEISQTSLGERGTALTAQWVGDVPYWERKEHCIDPYLIPLGKKWQPTWQDASIVILHHPMSHFCLCLLLYCKLSLKNGVYQICFIQSITTSLLSFCCYGWCSEINLSVSQWRTLKNSVWNCYRSILEMVPTLKFSPLILKNG